MVFSSNIFLFMFLPAALLGYYIINKPLRNMFLLVMSVVFYGWGEPRFVFVMLFSIAMNYVIALIISLRIKAKKLVLILGIGLNLGILFVFKYLDFTIQNVNLLGADIALRNIALPIGISFFTFQAMSYVIDVYRGTVEVQKNPFNLGLYISFFPQLIAGPIVRYSTIEKQLKERKESFDSFSQGVYRFALGLSKKVLIANNMALIADNAFAINDAQRSVAYAWMGAVAYSLQILFDFSGYSDMAIGLGKMFGFQFLENFDYPYMSKSVSEFWRRWHISLGQWFRDYVYFPLGGSRVKTRSRLVFNLFVVWLLTGIWHGASWNFIFWGLLYFCLITFEKLTGYPDKFKTNPGRQAYRILTLLCVLMGWVLFRAENGSSAVNYGLSMLGLTGNDFLCVNAAVAIREYGWFMLFGIILSTDIVKKAKEKILSGGGIRKTVFSTAALGVCLFCFLWSVSFIIMGGHNPFIYFNF